MKKNYILLLLLVPTCFYCQSWQWGKRGGSTQELDYNAAGSEEAHHLITDSNKNIYGISRVGQAGLNIDNVVKTSFDSGPITNSGSQSDFFVAKYATEACSPLAVNENSSLAPSLYPNPTKGIVQFDNSKRLFSTVSVYTYLGQEVIKALDCSQNENPILDLSKLANGVYLVRLTGVNGFFNTKIVKQ